jgi:UDP-N-acetylmuramate dehydrogenase
MSDVQNAIRAIKSELPELTCREREPLKNHTSFKLGGPVSAMLLPKNEYELRTALSALYKLGVTPLILGNGTNILASDAPLDIIAVKTSALCDMRTLGDRAVYAQCGVSLARLAVFAHDNGLSGLEFAHGIPGTLGGAVYMNAGAYGGDMRGVTSSCVVLGKNGAETMLNNAELDFSYRHSRLVETGEAALSCVLHLTPDEPNAIRARMDALLERRKASQPLTLPSAGSTFKRPKGGYAAALIDEAGLKGYRVGGAAVSDKHAGFVVNLGDAAFEDVVAVMEHVRDTVEARTGVTLTPEVKIIR